MKGGDLSNELAPYVAFRFENVIKKPDGKLDRIAKGHMLNLMDNTSFNIMIITTGDRRKVMAFCIKWGVPWNQVVEADNLYEIADICHEQRIMTYYDTDDNILYHVRSRGAERTQAEKWILAQD